MNSINNFNTSNNLNKISNYKNNSQNTKTSNFAISMIDEPALIDEISNSKSTSDNALSNLLGDALNSFNWNSTGDNTLNDNDIKTLNSKYDLNNLSHEDFAFLVADLTDLNVLSTEDARNLFLANSPPSPIITPTKTNNYYPDCYSTNTLDIVQKSYDDLKQQLDFYSSDDFWRNNLHVDNKDFIAFNQKESDRLLSYDKFFDIIETLS